MPQSTRLLQPVFLISSFLLVDLSRAEEFSLQHRIVAKLWSS